MEASNTQAPLDPGPAKQTKDEPKQTYVVQRRCHPTANLSELASGGDVWQDIETVHVPKRTQTKTILADALRGSDLLDKNERFRVLDVEAAAEFAVKPKERPAPEFEVVKV